jgi:hypothetical protein
MAFVTRLQRRGRRFEPVTAHKTKVQVNVAFQSLQGCEHMFNAARNPTKIQHPKRVCRRSKVYAEAKSNKIQHARNPKNQRGEKLSGWHVALV